MLKGRFAWILGGLVLLVVAAGVAAGVAMAVVGRQGGGNTPAAAGSKPGEGREVSLGQFTTNLAERGAAVQISFVFLVAGEKEAARVEAAKSELRDAVLGLLREKKPADLAGAQGKDRLAREVQARVNEVLGGPVVSRVLITEMLAQP